MSTTRLSRGRRAVATFAGAALVLGATLVSGGAASAAQPITEGEISWGFKQSFRAYVGNQTAALPPIGALPYGERITLAAPAEFDLDGTPASPNNPSVPNETLPYLLPVSAGSDGDVLRVESTGGVEYHFPSHHFDITISNVAVEVDGGSATIFADTVAIITEDFGDFKAGEYYGTDVAIGTSDSVNVTTNGSQISVSLEDTKLTQEGSDVLTLYPAGDALDSLTLRVTTGEAQTFDPQISVSRQDGFNPDGVEVVTVTGTGFDPAASISTRPPVTVGQPAGVYVVFGKFANHWRPSEGAPGANRTVISQKWAIPEPSFTQVGTDFPGQASQLVLLSEDGSFTAEVEVKTNDEVEGNYGIYTYPASGGVSAEQELYLPISFTGQDDLDVVVTVPDGDDPGEPGEPGEFTWRIDVTDGGVSLGTAALNGDHYGAGGQLFPVHVTDTRDDAPSWSISGQVSNFATSGGTTFQGSYLGWTPAVTTAGAGAVAGEPVSSGFVSGSGLSQSRTLASAGAGHAGGSASLGAAFDLRLPLSTEAGDYTGKLTLTAIN